MSLAGADAAAARRRANSTVGYYNVRLGPTVWRLGSSLGTEYNSNVRYTQNGEDDVIIRPGINAEMLWPVSDQNSLNLSLGGGYSAYLKNPDLSRWFVTPGSEIAFDVYAGDVWINLHDRFSITQDSYQDPTVAGIGDYARLENVAGVGAVWDLNKIIVRSGYDHANYLTVSGGSGNVPDGQNEIFNASVGYELKPEMTLGIEAGFAYIQYQKDERTIFENATQWNVGPFYDVQLSDYMRLNLSAGYTSFKPSLARALPFSFESDLDGFYASGQVRHRLNKYLDHSITAGRSISYTFYGGTADITQVRWQGNWHVLEEINLSTSVSYETGTQYNFGKESFDRVGGGFSLGRAITRKLGATAGYQYYVRNSDWQGSARDYSTHIVDLNLSYRF